MQGKNQGAECTSDSECKLSICSCSTVGHMTGKCGPQPAYGQCHVGNDCQSRNCTDENWPWEYCVGTCEPCNHPFIVGADGYCQHDPNPPPPVEPLDPPLSKSDKYTGPCVGDQRSSCAIDEFACYEQEGSQGVIQCNKDVKYWDGVTACHRFCHMEPLPWRPRSSP